MEFDINRFKVQKIKPVQINGEWVYQLTNGDQRTFKTYNEAYDAKNN